ncbi:degenerin deg-1-like [Actinia tenebrosa]|uniref:Degenerin deg-1-like n=1 Tax=Actinia tenebrosa TaxID=6105 RepID=A0A6P8I1F6_ACTTE|nr:degenerin deg-1-like [Actinia tenebrosa]XP_031561613.1 degenerin deg-1-like [Actinia tenebrosa]XP_031561614.1 degenerin deg-1-like [Actinia tenebrosa]
MSTKSQSKENEKPETKQSSALSVIKEFCDYTSIHGLGRAAGAKYLVHRLIWLLLFLGALTTSAYHFRELYTKYKSHPIGTSITIQSASTLPFPSVTICNLNPLRKTLLDTLPSKDYVTLKKILDKGEEVLSSIGLQNAQILPGRNTTLAAGILGTVNQLLTTVGPALPNAGNILSTVQSSLPDSTPVPGILGVVNQLLTTVLPNVGNLPSLQTSLPKAQSTSTPKLGNKMKSIVNNIVGAEVNELNIDSSNDEDDVFENIERLTKEIKLEETLSAILASIDENKLAAIGHQFNDTVVKCSYRGIDCKQSSIARWNTFWHYKYGNCFVFNPGGKMKTLKSNMVGPVQGLSLRLFVDQENYIDQLSPAAGFKILVNHQGQMPFPYEDGITVPPGISASFGINKAEIRRDNSREQSRCLDTKLSSPENLYNTEYGASYSLMACTGSCLAYNQRKYCECIEYKYPRDVATPVCDVLNSSVAKCLSKVLQMYGEQELNCSKECLLPCREESFKTTFSMAAWPSKTYEAEANLEAKVNPNATKNITFKDNYLEMRVYYKDLNNEVTEEKSSYGPVDFVSDIGGQLGLWLGVSVLAAVEVLELIVLLFIYLCGRKKKVRDRDCEGIIVLGTKTGLPKPD